MRISIASSRELSLVATPLSAIVVLVGSGKYKERDKDRRRYVRRRFFGQRRGPSKVSQLGPAGRSWIETSGYFQALYV